MVQYEGCGAEQRHRERTEVDNCQGLDMKLRRFLYATVEIVLIIVVLIVVWRYFNPLHKSTASATATQDDQANNLLLNGSFQDGLRGWSSWGYADAVSNSLMISNGALRVRNAAKQLQVGIKQHVHVSSGAIYKLSGAVRSTIANNSTMGFGARISYRVDPDQERQIVWMCEFNNWWGKSLVITNNYDGDAMIIAHVGFGNFVTTGEFKHLRLEKLR
jgi:hypothetical protein